MRQILGTACLVAVMYGGSQAQQPTMVQRSLQPMSGSVSTPNPGTNTPKPLVKKKKASPVTIAQIAPAPVIPAQSMPPVPATLMNSAPVKPSVTMESGLLTIDAPNSTLSDVLSGVRKATGATIEGAAPTERIAVKIGPGNPEQVIAALLQGTPYDYVILGSLGKNDVVTRILLTQSSAASGQAGAPGNPPSSQPQNDNLAERPAPDDGTAQPNQADNEPEQQPEPQQQQPAAQPPQQQQGQPQQQDANQPKTPEQLFKELQQLEQQKQPR